MDKTVGLKNKVYAVIKITFMIIGALLGPVMVDMWAVKNEASAHTNKNNMLVGSGHVEVDQSPPVERLSGYGSFNACADTDGTVQLVAPGPEGSHKIYWTCTGSRATIRYAETP